LTIAEFQRSIRDIYFDKDSRRGKDGTFRWLVEETGELARAMRKGDRHNMEEEFADVFAWLSSLATLECIDMEEACAKYANGCPKCHEMPCRCPEQTAERWRGADAPKTLGDQVKE
jgi:NTP pyrophosphatase (non-canonical NTP hydrolase)